MRDLSFVWLEITGKCQPQCHHCYAESGPWAPEGVMNSDDWLTVIDQSAGLGTGMVQFIGGEPTLHRGLPDLVGYALGRGLQVEVFSNLVHVSPQLWDVFAQSGVQLATSYYADRAEQHDSITKGPGSYARTKANIAEAVRRSIPLRVGVINVQDGQRVERACSELVALGVIGEIRVDYLRKVGRGAGTQQWSIDQLCGHCALGRGAGPCGPKGGCQPNYD